MYTKTHFAHPYTPEKRQKNTATHCNTLQHTAAHCNTLQRTATHCVTLYKTLFARPCTPEKNEVHCNTLQRTAKHCDTLYKTHFAHPLHTCNKLQHTAKNCNALQHTATHCNTLRHTIQNAFRTPLTHLPSPMSLPPYCLSRRPPVVKEGSGMSWRPGVKICHR